MPPRDKYDAPPFWKDVPPTSLTPDSGPAPAHLNMIATALKSVPDPIVRLLSRDVKLVSTMRSYYLAELCDKPIPLDMGIAMRTANKWLSAIETHPSTMRDMRSNGIEMERRERAGIPCGAHIHPRSILRATGKEVADAFACFIAVLNAQPPRVMVPHDGPDALELGNHPDALCIMHKAYFVPFARAAAMCVLHAIRVITGMLEPPYAQQFARVVNTTVALSRVYVELGLGRLDTDDDLTQGLGSMPDPTYVPGGLGHHKLLFAKTTGEYNTATTQFAMDWLDCCNVSLAAVVSAYNTVAGDALADTTRAVHIALSRTATPDPAPVAAPPRAPTPPPAADAAPQPSPALVSEWERCSRRVAYDAVLAAYGTRAVAYDHDALSTEFSALSSPTAPHLSMRGFPRDVAALAAQMRELRRK